MEFLKELFSGGALTYDQLAEAVQAKGVQLADLSTGAYAPKADLVNLQTQVTTLTGQLGEANKKLAGFDPAWQEKAETAQKALADQAFDFALDKALTGARAKNTTAVKALLDREKLSFAGGELIGLDKQLDALRKDESSAFLFAPAAQMKTGMSHQGGGEGAPDKKEEANAALRALFGKE